MTSKEALVKLSGENLSPVMASWASLGVARLGQQPGDSEQRHQGETEEQKPRSISMKDFPSRANVGQALSHPNSVAIRLVPKVCWDQVQDGRDVGKILNTCSSNRSSRFPDGIPEVFEAYSSFTNFFFSPKNSTGLFS